jgi:hypothetical protein
MKSIILKGKEKIIKIRNLHEGTYKIEQTGEDEWEAGWGIITSGCCIDGYKTLRPPYKIGERVQVKSTERFVEVYSIETMHVDDGWYWIFNFKEVKE